MNEIVKRISNQIWFEKNDEERKILEYGLRITLSEFINNLIILIIAFITRSVLESILYVITFDFLRQYSGSYHAKTYISCGITYLVFYGVFLLLFFNILTVSHNTYSLLTCISILFLFLVIPVENKNHKLSNREFRIFQIKGYSTVILYLIILSISKFYNNWIIAKIISIVLIETMFSIILALFDVKLGGI